MRQFTDDVHKARKKMWRGVTNLVFRVGVVAVRDASYVFSHYWSRATF